ncbi:hypothetical protein U1Q18_000139 [Sarracenia purpurea var. burkii]
MKKKMNLILSKCKTLSRQLGRTSSYSSLRSKSTRKEFWVGENIGQDDDEQYQSRQTILVGRSRRQYVISSKYLNHPLLNALIDRSKQNSDAAGDDYIAVECEVVLFDHLLWMLENADPNFTSDSLEELADLYAF